MTIGYIYKFLCNQTGECYIGSTFNISQRQRYHKIPSNPCSSKRIIERGDYTFTVIDELDVRDHNELIRKEHEYIKSTENCINTRKNAFLTPKQKSDYVMEYRRNHPEYMESSKNAYKKFYESHKDRFKEYRRRYYEKQKELKRQQLIRDYIDSGANI